MYKNLYGLSCIENQVLAILRQRGEPIEYLYSDAYVPLEVLYTRFVKEGASPYYFDQVERIQDVLKTMRIISLEKKHVTCIRKLSDDIRSGVIILIRVKPDFNRAVLFSRGSRNDHFVRVKASGDGFLVCNDIPERTVFLSEERFSEVFHEEYYRMNILRRMNEEDTARLWERRPHTLTVSPCIFPKKDHESVENITEKLRDMVLIYKTLRCRMVKYYGKYTDTSFMAEAMQTVERWYAMLEYCHLKGGIAFEKYAGLSELLNETDRLLINELTLRMEI